MIKRKSSVKNQIQSLKRAFKNKSIQSKINTYVKKLEKEIFLKNLQQAKSKLTVVESIIMKAVSKKILKLNTASRKIKKLTSKIKSL